MRTKDLAQAVDMSERTIIRWSKDGKIPFEVDGNGWRVYNNESLKVAMGVAGRSLVNLEKYQEDLIYTLGTLSPKDDFALKVNELKAFTFGNLLLEMGKFETLFGEMSVVCASLEDRPLTDVELDELNSILFDGTAKEHVCSDYGNYRLLWKEEEK